MYLGVLHSELCLIVCEWKTGEYRGMGCNTSKDAIKAVEAAASAADNTAEELADSVEDKVAELFEGRPLDFAGF